MKFLTILLIGLFNQLAYSQTYNLTISVLNIKKITGVIEIGVYNEKRTFPHEKEQYKVFFIKVSKYSEVFTIKDLPKGEYAIAIYHDENSDGICNTNFFGIPKEGYGFSNNYKPILSSPSFNDCKIDLNLDKLINIKLLY